MDGDRICHRRWEEIEQEGVLGCEIRDIERNRSSMGMGTEKEKELLTVGENETIWF